MPSHFGIVMSLCFSFSTFDQAGKVSHEVSIYRKTINYAASLIKAAWAAFDIRDVFLFGGLSLLGYGLYLRFGQWLAFIVCGMIFMALGCVMRGRV